MPMVNGADSNSGTPRSHGAGGGGASRIPLPRTLGFRRSASMRLRGEKVSPTSAAAVAPSAARLHRQFPAISEAEPWRASALGASAAGDLWGLRAGRLRSQSVSGGAGGAFLTDGPRRDDCADVDVDDDLLPDDASSVRSFGSACSAMSCDHAYFARNGTTFSGRRMKYVVHCSTHAGETDDYLTPTQRASRQIRRLKVLLQQAQKEINHKDQDIFRLTKELVELRLFKASLSAPPESVDGAAAAVTAAAAAAPEDAARASGPQPGTHTPVSPEPEEVASPGAACLLQSDPVSQSAEKTSSPSLADSGHFEDIAASPEPPRQQQPTQHQQQQQLKEPQEMRIDPQSPQQQHMLEQRLQKLQAAHLLEAQELKERHNDRVESLLQRLSDVNNKYCELRSEYDRAQDKIRQLERETETLQKSLVDHEETDQNMYLKMYMKGQEAARFEHADQVLEFAHTAPSRVSVPELLQQLQVTENKLETMKAMYRRIVETRTKKGELDPEITLQFLKSAIYYFLTDKENHQGHLNAIESILGYNENEKINIEKAYKMYIRK